MQRWGALLALILWASGAQGTTQTVNTVPSSGASFLTTLQSFLQQEDADRYALIFNSVVVSGCTHSTGAGLTKSISSCIAFPGGYYVSASGSVTYSDNDTCWLAVSKDTTPSTIDNFVRQGSTNFLVDCTSVTEPTIAAADDGIVIAEITTSGGSVTSSTQLYTRVPYGDVSPNQGIRSNATGDLEGVTLTNGQLLIGATGAKPTVGSITGGTGVTVTNGSGTISVAIGQSVATNATPSFSTITSTVSSGTPPLVITSQTKVPNLNVDLLDSGDWTSPGPIGSTTPNTGVFTTLKVPAAGSTLSGLYKGTGTIDFGSTLDGDCAAASTITVTGAAAGDAVFVGAPTAAQGAGRIFYGYANAANTVSVIFCNMSGGTVDPASGTFVAWVLN